MAATHHTYHLTIIIGLAVSVIAVGVTAMESPTMSELQRSRFMAWDKDSDGYLTPMEAAKVDGLSHAFDRVDTDHDGRVDAVEYAVFERVNEE